MPQRRTMARWLGSVLSLTLAMGTGAQTPDADAPSRRDQAFAQAMALYDRSHWASAWRSFAELADAGHRDAAWLALQMWRHGPRLYGMAFDASPQRRARWQALLEAPRDEPPWEPGPHGC
jgi:2,4-dienoyl-CoA reductase-like NADH-dependent reductase (Old Yellow Enzyme family)